MKINSQSNRKFNFLFVFLLCIGSIFNSLAQSKHYRVVIEASKQQISLLKSKGLEADHFHYKNGKATSEISKKDLQFLRDNDVRFKIKIRNLEKRIPKINKRIDRRNKNKTANLIVDEVPTPENFSLGANNGFHSFSETIKILDKMRELYPSLITVKSSIGSTIEGRSIYSVKISDNADVDESENEDELLFTSIHHAREPIGLSQNLFYMWYLLENYSKNEEIKVLVDHSELYFIPIINPDGYVYNEEVYNDVGQLGFWRKNRRINENGTIGVDLNRNYGYQWAVPGGSSDDGSTEIYHGTKPFSEPETQVLKEFVESHEFITTLNYHSFGNLLIHPWGYKPDTFTPDQPLFEAMGSYMTEENAYASGTANQVIGYWSGGSSDDWMYGEQSTKPKIFSLTPEVGEANDGFWPPSTRIIPLCNEALPLNIKIMRMGAKYARIIPSDTIQSLTTLGGKIDFSVKRFSLKQAQWKVSLSSRSSFVTSFGTPKTFSDLAFLAVEKGNIDFNLDSSTPLGTKIPVSITIDNGSWSYSKEVVVVYEGEDVACELVVPTKVSALAIGMNTATITWSASENVTYDFRVRKEEEGDWEVVSLSEATYVLRNLDANTSYEVQVRSKCSDGTVSSYSLSHNFKTLGDTSYCEAVGENIDDEYISRVQLGEIDNISTVGDIGYSDFTEVSTTLLKQEVQTISITPFWSGAKFEEAYSVWIDYNNDGDFDDIGEKVWSKSKSEDEIVTGNFVVPNDATIGLARMRVIMQYDFDPSVCGTFEYGEVEDYSVMIIDDIDGKEYPDILTNDFYIRPNPVTANELHVMFSSPIAARFKITDVNGRVVLKGKSSNSIDVSNLPSATYFLTMYFDNKQKSVRFIKE